MNAKTTTTIYCKKCDKPISLPRWEANKRKFCSKSCSSLFNMQNEMTRDKIFSKLHSPESNKKRIAALNTESYSKKRSQISKNCSDKVRTKARETMIKLHEVVHKDEEWKKKVSESAKKRIKNGTFGGGLPKSKNASKGLMFGKQCIHEKSGIIMRSTWEKDFANLLDSNNIKWEYESDSFYIKTTRYTPDFKIVGTNILIDVKPKRRFVLQPEKISRYNMIKDHLKEIGMKLLIVDKSEFNTIVDSLIGGGLLLS